MGTWKNIASLKKAIEKHRFLRKRTLSAKQRSGTAVELKLEGLKVPAITIEAKMGYDLTWFSTRSSIGYTRPLVGYRPATGALNRLTREHQFLFGPVKTLKEGYNVNDLFVLLYAYVNKKLDPLSEKLNEDEDLLKMCEAVYKKWNPVEHIFAGNLFPVTIMPPDSSEPGDGEESGVVVTVLTGQQLGHAVEACKILEHLSRAVKIHHRG